MIDRHQLACQPVRDLLVDYLRERQPAMDYGSLEQLARRLGMFWADLEAHHPGIDSLHLPAEVADAWKQRLRTKQTTITAAGGKTVIDAERICHREFLTPVRAFYLDLAQWAVDDPARWAQWAVPCPVGPAETIQGKVQRHRKSRMDARTRERLPVLPVLVRSSRPAARRRPGLLRAARAARPGSDLHRRGTDPDPLRRPRAATASVWADDPATGKRAQPHRRRRPRLLGLGDRRGAARHRHPHRGTRPSSATTAWSSTGSPAPASWSRCCRSPRPRPTPNGSWSSAPNSPTCSAPSSAAIRGTSRAVPLVAAYDDHERLWLPPAPLLFQRRIGAENQRHPRRAPSARCSPPPSPAPA